jgi:cytochrome c biogenesis protein CcmG, thiol:disulfide interchange protein DsbE
MKRVTGIDLALRVLLLMLTLVFVGVVGKAVYAPPPHVVVAGEKAPAFQVHADNGRSVSVPNFGGKVLILNFWATWCPPCIEETPSLSQLAKDYASRGVVVLGISVDTNESEYRAFLSKYKPEFLTVREAQVHRDYGTFMYPETYIIDSGGKVVQKIAQGADWSSPDVRSYIDSLL